MLRFGQSRLGVHNWFRCQFACRIDQSVESVNNHLINLPRKRSKPVGAPKLTIQRHVPLWLRALGWGLAVTLGAGAAILVWQQTMGKGMALRESLVQETEQLKVQLSVAEQERIRLQVLADSAESKLNVERTAQQALATQLRNLEADNAKLKTDLAYMESLLPSGAANTALSIRRFQVEKDKLPNQWVVKALLVQADKIERDFSGSWQIVVTGVQANKPATFTWPEASKDVSKEVLKEAQLKAKLGFKRTQRIDEVFATPADFQVKSMQLRVLEQGSIRAQQSVSL
jgi:hypothetical protein